MIIDKFGPAKIDFKKLTITSLIFGFFLIPVHELGHVICDWMTGHPATMSYARDRLLSGGETPFLGLLGGPLLPLIISAFSVVQIYRQKNLSLFYPLAILGSFERLVLYISGSLPSDERSLAAIVGWNMHSFQYIFLSLEVLLLFLVLLSFIRYKVHVKQAIFVFLIPLLSFFACAAIGVFVVERFVFPGQFKIQFG
ncbi:MAG: hypothetical protein ABSG19_14460 [Candidatus Aminicenantales bacterium]